MLTFRFQAAAAVVVLCIISVTMSVEAHPKCGNKECGNAPQCKQYICKNKVCTLVNKAKYTPCADNDKCTYNYCSGGVCKSEPKCKSFTGQCVQNCTCNPATGKLTVTYKPKNTTCSDGKLCTVGDYCNGYGVCKSGKPACPSFPFGGCTVNKCNATSGACYTVTARNYTRCRDGNNCTINDVCKAGVCVGEPKCKDTQCQTKTCNATTARCISAPKANGTVCSDGNKCTLGDFCVSGHCTGSNSTVTCADSNLSDCKVPFCYWKTGTCVNAYKRSGSSCNDGKSWTKNDKCTSNGVCKGKVQG